jgi:hypothetical protein
LRWTSHRNLAVPTVSVAHPLHRHGDGADESTRHAQLFANVIPLPTATGPDAADPATTTPAPATATPLTSNQDVS